MTKSLLEHSPRVMAEAERTFAIHGHGGRRDSRPVLFNRWNVARGIKLGRKPRH